MLGGCGSDNEAFSEDEKARMISTELINIITVKDPESQDMELALGKNTFDKVFLLDVDVLDKYYSNDKDRVANYEGDVCWWWLRSSGRYGTMACTVSGTGSFEIKTDVNKNRLAFAQQYGLA